MRAKLPRVMCHDEGHEDTVTDVITLNKKNQRIVHLGLTLSEAKQLLSTTQRHLLRQQVDAYLDTCADCPDCGTPLKLKARASRSFRTVFGTWKCSSPRLDHCDCTRRTTASFRPLSALFTEAVAPELLYMEAKWSSLVSYGTSLDALKDFLPLEVTLDVKTMCEDTLKVTTRLEAELGEEHQRFLEGDPSDWDLVPWPDGCLKVGIDGGYVRHGFDKQHSLRGHCRQRMLSFTEDEDEKAPSHKRLGFVQTLDTKPKRRLDEVVPSSRLTDEPGDHVSRRRHRHLTSAPGGDEPEGHSPIGLVASHNKADGMRPIRERSGALRGGRWVRK